MTRLQQSNLSFGRTSGRSGSFGVQKKERRRKQEFHKHKIKLADEEKLDFGALKERIILSLTHLGKQQFSQDPGGYGLQNWIKNFNLLLDDFEERSGARNLPNEYFEKRRELSSTFVKPSIGSELDSLISKLQKDEKELVENLQRSGARLAHDRESTERVAKIDALNMERADIIEQLGKERRRLADRKKEIEDSRKFLKRFFSRARANGMSLSSIEAKISELETKVDNLDRRIAELRARHKSGGYRVLTEKELEQELPKQYSALEETRSKLSELQTKKLSESDSSEIRENATKSISEIISKIELAPEAN